LEEFSLNLPKVAAPDSRKDFEDLHHHHEKFFEVEHSDESQDEDLPGPSVLEPRQVSGYTLGSML